MCREADIDRVKYYRNTVYGHAKCASVDDPTFNTYWRDIRDTLLRLGGATRYKSTIDKLETECMDPENEYHYKEALSQWKKDEENVIDKLDEVIKRLDDIKPLTMSQRKESVTEGECIVSKELLESCGMCTEKGHETKPLNHYCKNCKVSICDTCGETRHTQHTKVNIQQAAEEEKLKMKETVEQMNMQISELETQIAKTKNAFAISKRKISAARNSVRTTVEELVRVLKEHEKSTVAKLDVIEEAQQRDYKIEVERFEASVNELKRFVRNCNEILRRDTTVETLQLQQAEIERSKGVLRATKMDIYKPCHVLYLKDTNYVKNLTCADPGKVLVSNTDPQRSYVKGYADLTTAEAGCTKMFDINTMDSDGKQCYHKIDEIKVEVRGAAERDLANKIDDWMSRGTYRIRYTPDRDGEHEVTVFVNDQPLPCSPWRVHVAPHRYRFSCNFQLSRKGQFREPYAIAIDSKTGNLAVADRKKQRVRLFSTWGDHIADFGLNGSELIDPTSVAFNHSSDVLVTASGSIHCFNVSGKFKECINNKDLKFPFSLTFACDGRMVVCDTGDKSVKVLSPDGTELLHSFSVPDSDDSPWEAVFHQDMFFVSYPTAGCVKTFNKDGDFLYNIGVENSDEGQLSKPRGLVVDAYNNLVVCDEENKTLKVFKLDGTFLNVAGNRNLDCPWCIAVSPNIRWPWLFIADLNKKTVVTFE